MTRTTENILGLIALILLVGSGIMTVIRLSQWIETYNTALIWPIIGYCILTLNGFILAYMLVNHTTMEE